MVGSATVRVLHTILVDLDIVYCVVVLLCCCVVVLLCCCVVVLLYARVNYVVLP